MTLSDDQLRHRLIRLADHARTTPAIPAPTRRHRPRRRLPALVPLVAIAVAACVLALIVVGHLYSHPQTVQVSPLNRLPIAGSTVPLPSAPIPGRIDAASAWTGREWLIWGGITASNHFLHNGASYDPHTRHWRLLPVAPIAGRAGPASEWTGSEWVVIGGTDSRGQALTSGAAFNPTTRRWTAIAPAPFPPGQSAPAVWTGHEVIIISGLAQATTPEAESYDPSANTWRVLASPPGQATAPYASAVWTGTLLAVLRSAPSQLSTPVGTLSANNSGRTATPPPTLGPPPAGPSPDSGLFVAVYDPVTGRWSSLASTAFANGGVPTLGWTGTELVALDPRHRSLAYRFATNSWGPLRPPSSTDLKLVFMGGAPVWTGSSAIYWAGGRMGLLYNASTDAWTTFPAGNLATRQDPLLAWTGNQLLGWGGLLNTSPATTENGIVYTPGG